MTESSSPPPVANCAPDWERERKRWLEWSPSKSMIASLRAYQRHDGRAGTWHRLLRFANKRRLQFWSVICGSDIHPDTRVGGGLVLPHPNGVVMHRDAVIGVNRMIMQQVTIGQVAQGAVPKLGSGVYVGAGAKVLGPVVIGDRAAIGANAVVLQDVPADATAVGVPAQVVRQRSGAANSK